MGLIVRTLETALLESSVEHSLCIFSAVRLKDYLLDFVELCSFVAIHFQRARCVSTGYGPTTQGSVRVREFSLWFSLVNEGIGGGGLLYCLCSLSGATSENPVEGDWVARESLKGNFPPLVPR